MLNIVNFIFILSECMGSLEDKYSHLCELFLEYKKRQPRRVERLFRFLCAYLLINIGARMKLRYVYINVTCLHIHYNFFSLTFPSFTSIDFQFKFTTIELVRIRCCLGADKFHHVHFFSKNSIQSRYFCLKKVGFLRLYS